MFRTVITTLLFTTLLNFCCAQQISFGVKLGGIGYHPKSDGNEKFYRYKINKKGNLTFFRSVTFCFSYNFSDFIGIKAVQTLLINDCTGHLAGVSHIGFNFFDDIVNFKSDIHQGSFSFGPLFYYRKNWNKMEGYKTDNQFIRLTKNKVWERKFVWYGGQIQYDYFFNNHQAVSLNFLPGYPYIYAVSAGMESVVGR